MIQQIKGFHLKNLILFFQARYRQYFEEDLADPNNDAEAMIPMETQVIYSKHVQTN